jgi:hypothetical protein
LMPNIDQSIEEDNWYEWLTLAISVGDVPKRHPISAVTSISCHVHNVQFLLLNLTGPGNIFFGKNYRLNIFWIYGIGWIKRKLRIKEI